MAIGVGVPEGAGSHRDSSPGDWSLQGAEGVAAGAGVPEGIGGRRCGICSDEEARFLMRKDQRRSRKRWWGLKEGGHLWGPAVRVGAV